MSKCMYCEKCESMYEDRICRSCFDKMEDGKIRIDWQWAMSKIDKLIDEHTQLLAKLKDLVSWADPGNENKSSQWLELAVEDAKELIEKVEGK